MVAPTGITNRDIRLSILLFSSTHLKVTGIVALLDAVPNAVASAGDQGAVCRLYSLKIHFREIYRGKEQSMMFT
jgi:hypothetical protein